MKLLLAVALSVAVSSCTLLRSTAPAAEACATDAAKAAVADLLPTVETILIGGAPDWRAQLDALKARAGQALLCAVQAAIAQFTAPASTSALVFQDAEREAAATRGRAYLAGQ